MCPFLWVYFSSVTPPTANLASGALTYNSEDVATASSVSIDKAKITLSDSDNFEVKDVTGTVTATITKATVNVTAITGITAINQFATNLTGNKTVETNGSGDITVTGIQNGETISVDYAYAYPDSTTAGTRTDVGITSVALTDSATHAANANYTLGSPNATTGTGSVTERTIDSITVTAPTQFASATTYGDTLNLSGLKVQITYDTAGTKTTDEYAWKSNGNWDYTEAGQTAVEVTSVPFTYAWDNGTSATNGDVLTVTDHNGKRIKATSTDDNTKSGTSDTVTVNPKEVSNITITGTDISKTYDGTDTADDSTFTYAIADTLVDSSDVLTVEPTSVKYSTDDAHTTAAPLVFTWGTTLGGASAGNYTLATTPNVTGIPNGTIAKRMLTVTAVSGITAIDQFSDVSNPVDIIGETPTYATADATTGLVAGDTAPVIDYKYQYSSSAVAGNNIPVNVTNIEFNPAQTNYDLANDTLSATGIVNAKEVTEITVSIPNDTYEYGDLLDLSGTTVTLKYTATYSEVYTTANGTDWTLSGNAVTAPFTLDAAHGDLLDTVDTITVTATSTTNSVSNGDDVTVSQRKVNVTATGTGITKVYDGNQTYTNSGVITLTPVFVNALPSGSTIQLPTVTSATYTYDSKNASAYDSGTDTYTKDRKVSISNITLSDTANFVVNTTPEALDATITKRPITLEQITNVPAIDRYSDISTTHTGATASSPTDAVFTAPTGGADGIVSGETVTVTYDYKYDDNNPTGNETTVTLSNVSQADTNYNMTGTPTAKATVNDITVTVNVTNPSMFGNTVTYGDKLDLTGMKVEIVRGSVTDTYVATQTGTTIAWTKNGSAYSDPLPFTLAWSDGDAVTPEEVLSVTDHNTKTIDATFTASGAVGSGSAVTITPKSINAITATPSGTVTKEYDGDETIDQTFTYTSTDVLAGDTVTIGADAKYNSKNVDNANAVVFTNLSVSGNTNYKLGDSASVGNVAAAITKKTVNITAVYVPSTYVDLTASAPQEHTYTNAKHAASATAVDTVTTTGLIAGEEADMTFKYTVSYAVADLATIGTKNVTLSKESVDGTSVNPSTNYTFIWPSSLTGAVHGDKVLDLSIGGEGGEVTPILTDYTHGAELNLVGMAVTVETEKTGKITYTVVGSVGSAAWDTPIPDYVNVSLNGIDLKDNANLNGKAHHVNMDGKKIIVSATGVTSAEIAEMKVAKKQLTATASVTGTLEKVYDGTDVLPTGTTVTYPAGTDEVQTFDDLDDVTINATAKYEDADVNMNSDGVTVDNKAIKITNISLSGTDKENYIAPTSIADLTGKITPFEIDVTDIGDAIPDATYNDESTKSDTVTTNNYTAVLPTGISKPDIEYTYTYSTVASLGSQPVEITVNGLKTADDNFTVKDSVSDKTGTVKTTAITSLAIKTQPKLTYKYGEKLDLTSLVVTLNGSIDVTYGTADWTAYGLSIDGTLQHDDLMKSAYDDTKLTVKAGEKSAETDKLQVDKLKVYIKATPVSTITKEYDGDANVEQAVDFEIAVAGNYEGTDYEGVLAADTDIALNITSTSGNEANYQYDNANVGTGKVLTYGGTALALTGTNAGEYDITVQAVTGEITPKTVTITPTVTVYADVHATTFKVITKDSSDSVSPAVLGTDYTVDGLLNSDTVSMVKYTVQVPVDDIKVAGNYTYEAYNLTPNEASTDGNYKYTWADAKVNVVENSVASAVITTAPKLTGYTYGDTIDLTGMKVEVTYANNSTYEYTYGSQEWIDDGLTAVWEDGSALSTTDVLKTTDNQGIKVEVTADVTTDATADVEVGKRELTLTATATDLTQVYNATPNADKSQISVAITGGAVAGDTLAVDTSAMTATYADKNVGTDKPITLANITVTGDNADQYTYTQPTGIVGDITEFAIIISEVTVPEVLVGSTDTDPAITAAKYDTNPFAGDKITIALKAIYAASDVLVTGTPTVTIDKTVTGADKDNYTVSVPPTAQGKVVDNVITGINVTGPTKTSYIHTDGLDLSGMKIKVTYMDIKDDNVFTYDDETGKWTAQIAINGSTSIETADLPVTLAIDGNTATHGDTLRHDEHNGDELTVTGGTVVKTAATLTVDQKAVDTFTVAPSTPGVTYNKEYDTTAAFDISTADIDVGVSGIKVPDEVYATMDNGALEYNDKEVNAIPDTKTFVVADKTKFGITGSDAINYKLADEITVNLSDLIGNITKATLDVEVTKVPSIVVGGNKVVEVEFVVDGYKGTETGLITKVTGEYADNTAVTAQDAAAMTNWTSDPATLDNYDINIIPKNGTVTAKLVKAVEVVGPTKADYVHGETFDLEGTKIIVKYADDETDNRTYEYKNDQWFETTSGSDVAIAQPEDVEIVWGTTTTAVADDAKLRLDDTDKALVDNNDKKETAITANATVYDTNGTQPTASATVTIAKKQLTLEVSGALTKTYDGNENITAETTGTPLTFVLGGVDGTDVSLDETNTQEGIKFATKDYTNTAQALVLGTIVISGTGINYYELPSGNAITNNATGQINKKAFVVTAITDGPSVETGANATDTMTVGKDKYTTDPVAALVGNEDIEITVTYNFTNGTDEPNAAAPVTYSAPAVVETAVSANYDVTFNIAPGTGKVTGGEVTSITVKSPDKTAYTHGDTIALDGMEITLTYDNNAAKTDKYAYDPTSKKWTYTKNGVEQPTKVELPSEIALTYTGGSAVAPTDVLSHTTHNNKTMTATVTTASGSTLTGVTDAITVAKKELTVTVSNTDAITQPYAKTDVLADTSKLVVTIADEGTGITADTSAMTAKFASANVVRDADGNAVAQNITAEGIKLSDNDNYTIKIVNTATGTITPIAVTATANTVPSIKEEETNLVVSITDVTTTGVLSGDEVTITWEGTYNKETQKVDTTTKREVTGSAAVNYDVTFTPDEMQGSVTEKVVTDVTINTQPGYSTTSPKHGDKLGENGLDNLEYTVTYSDGSETKHKKENGEWVEDGTYTKPEEGTKITWNGTTEEANPESVIRKDKDNTVTISIEGKSATTDVVAADVKPIKITATGLYSKVYDGTTDVKLNETTPEITYTVEGLAEGDTITVTATPVFTSPNANKIGEAYSTPIEFTNVSISGNTEFYVIEKDENDKEIANIPGQITPKTINITSIEVPSKKKNADTAVSVEKSTKFTADGIIEKDNNTVTISYTGTYSSTAKVANNVPVTVNAADVKIVADENAVMNYIVGTVTGAEGKVTSGGGGGGGGGSSNSLTIKYELEDGKAGEAVLSKVTYPADSEAQNWIGEFKTKPADPTVIWTSSDEKVVKVDENGIVTFVGEGTATVTAQSKTNTSLKDTVEITVTPSLATPKPTEAPVRDELIQDMLNPYIVGYDNNVFGPELPISREEVATIFARLIANDLYMDKSYDTSFFDVGDDFWSKDYIGYLEGYDVISGYKDGTFKPKAYITRAEMAVMMAKAEGFDISGYMDGSETGFADIPEGYNEWATKAIKCLTERGIMQGYEDGTFRADRPITRAETVATVNRVLADMEIKSRDVLPTDMTDAHWAYEDVVFAMNHRILKDAAADPNKFIWSEEFDKNMETVVETVETEETDSDAGEQSPAEAPASTEVPAVTPTATTAPSSEEEDAQ